MKWNDETSNFWTESRIPELLNLQYGEGRIEAAQRPFVIKYLEKRLPHTGRCNDESRALRTALNTVQPRPKIWNRRNGGAILQQNLAGCDVCNL